MTELLQKAIAEITRLSDEQQDEVAEWILERLSATDDDTESSWEETTLIEKLDDTVNANGSLDFDKLRTIEIPLTLEELYPEADVDDGS